MKPSFIFLSIIFLSIQTGFAQVEQESDSTAKIRRQSKISTNRAFGLISSFDLTYTGYSTILAFEYEKKKHSFYAGPRFSITNSYLLKTMPAGLNFGYRYFFLSDLKRWKVYSSIDYLLYSYKAFKEQNTSGKKRNFIHEINLSYGVQFKISEKFYVSNSIGVGKYFESYYNYKSLSTSRNHGYDALLRLFIKYKL